MMDEFVRRRFGVRAGAIARRAFQRNFELGGFLDGGLKRWKPSGRLNKGRSADSMYKTLLSSRNHLFSSFVTRPGVGKVDIVNTAPYASVHNNGERAGRGIGFVMPRRQFMGQSRELDREIDAMVRQELERIIRIK